LPEITLLEGNHEALFFGKEPLELEWPLVRHFFHASFSALAILNSRIESGLLPLPI
jgi:hypothetical protein